MTPVLSSPLLSLIAATLLFIALLLLLSFWQMRQFKNAGRLQERLADYKARGYTESSFRGCPILIPPPPPIPPRPAHFKTSSLPVLALKSFFVSLHGKDPQGQDLFEMFEIPVQPLETLAWMKSGEARNHERVIVQDYPFYLEGSMKTSLGRSSQLLNPPDGMVRARCRADIDILFVNGQLTYGSVGKVEQTGWCCHIDPNYKGGSTYPTTQAVLATLQICGYVRQVSP